MSQKRIDILRKKCSDEGLDLRKVFRRAQVPESTIQNWDRKEPEAFSTWDKLETSFEEMKEEKLRATAEEFQA